MKQRIYTAFQFGQPVQSGTFTDEKLLRRDFPGPAYSLLLDKPYVPEEVKPFYAEARAMDYPSFQELADAIYHERKGNNEPMKAYIAKCDAVKARHPKVK